jgi:hypothetical protein
MLSVPDIVIPGEKCVSCCETRHPSWFNLACFILSYCTAVDTGMRPLILLSFVKIINIFHYDPSNALFVFFSLLILIH